MEDVDLKDKIKVPEILAPAGSMESLKAAYEKRRQEAMRLIPQGLCASVYTQVSDIEDEVNGIYTYDRKVKKI